MTKKNKKKTTEEFKPLRPNLWAPMTTKEKERAKNLEPFAKALVALIRADREKQ